MDGAALVVLLAGVGFGWQPMSDGSPRYEYIVQVDPELATSLADGESIPVSGDIPEEIQPIGRVRLVIGRGEPPRERLVTRLKPVAGDAPLADAGGVVPAQYNDYVDPRYAATPQPTAPQPILPGGTSGTVAPSAVNRWNSGEADLAGGAAANDAALPPTGQQLFGNAPTAVGSAWNDNVATPAAEALTSATQRLRDQAAAPVREGLSNATTQLRNGFDNVDQRLQDAASALGDRTKRLVDELGRPINPPPALTARDLRRPDRAAAAPAAQNWNQDAPPPGNPLRTDIAGTSPESDAEQTWSNQAGGIGVAEPVASQPTYGGAQPGTFAPPTSAAAGAPSQPSASQPWNDWNAGEANGMTTAPSTAASTPTPARQTEDPWRNVPDPRLASSAGGATGEVGAASSAAPFRGAGANWPPASGATPPVAGEVTANPTSSGGTGQPEIDRRMLSESATRPLDGPELAAPSLSGVAGDSAARAATAQPSAADARSQRQPSGDAPAAGSRDNAFIALVAWVLLFGSAFGNLYLFWSYLDIRQKYRSLVRKTARAVGSRFSAA